MIFTLGFATALAATGPIPVQGALTDASGAPVSGTRTVTFQLLGDGSTELWSDTVTVAFERGLFSAMLDDVDFEALGGHGSLSLTVSVAGDVASAPTPIAWAPRAGWAAHTAWDGIVGRPDGLDDGDQDTTYTAGAGLLLTGTAFSVNNAVLTPSWTTLLNRPADLLDGDQDTTYGAGAGLLLSGTTFSAVPYAAGSGLTLSGTTFAAVPVVAGSGLVRTGNTFSVAPEAYGVPGPAGPTGPQGPAGPSGPAGQTGVTVAASTPSGPCASEGALLWDRGARTLRICNDSLTWTDVDSGSPTVGGRYQHVLTMNAAGAVTAGNWTDARNRVIGGQDCQLRFDDRLAHAEYIEWTATQLRFDFQPLQAWHNSWDAYAMIELTLGTRAGLGASYRKGHADTVYKRSLDQNSIYEFYPQEVKLYCAPGTTYTNVASFNAAGGATVGSYAALFAAAIDRQALCKVRWADRLHVVNHVEQQGNTLYFDFAGLEANHDSWDAYAYIKIVNGTTAGLGASYRRGHGANSRAYVRGFDREQHAEAYYAAAPVEVLCADVYTDVFAMSATGAMTTGTWAGLRQAVIDEGRECRVGYNQRVSTPQYIEYTDTTLEFNFDNLAAWHNGWDSYAGVRLANGSFAALDSNYRKGNADLVWAKSAVQNNWQGRTDYPVTVRCAPGTYNRVLTMSSGGIPLFGDWLEFYPMMRDQTGAPECKLRFDGRIGDPEIIETTGDGYYFDFHSLAGYHDSWDSYASFYLRAFDAVGIAGSYRRGHDDLVWKRDRAQNSLGAINAYDVDVICR